MLSNHTSDPIESQLREEALYKPYQSLNAYLKKKYGEKIYKIALDGGFTCPNRDGTCGTRGCIFCSAGGSGEFATAIRQNSSIDAQITQALARFGNKQTGQRFIAYFQAYTNTYAPLPYLEEVYRSALSHSKVCGISIATRPDCLGPEVLALLAKLKGEYPDKFLWIELGLQTIHEETAHYIRRGYPLSCFEKACTNLKTLKIPFIVHTILGLPGETDRQVLETMKYLNHIAPFGIKLQLLHILKNTDLAEDYEKGIFEALTPEHYLDLLVSCLAHLSPDIVIHRVTGDGPKDLLIAPKWSLDKRKVLNSLHHRMKEQGIRQGDLYEAINKDKH